MKFEVETKYDIGDVVWVARTKPHGEIYPHKARIVSIQGFWCFRVAEDYEGIDRDKVYYSIECETDVCIYTALAEEVIYATKEECEKAIAEGKEERR